jgi:hypothetical protein
LNFWRPDKLFFHFFQFFLNGKIAPFVAGISPVAENANSWQAFFKFFFKLLSAPAIREFNANEY